MTQQAVTVSNQIVMGPAFWIATSIFLLAYVLIMWKKIHKTTIAIFGGALVIVLRIVTQEDACYSMELGIFSPHEKGTVIWYWCLWDRG